MREAGPRATAAPCYLGEMHRPLEQGTGSRAEKQFRKSAERLAETQATVLRRFLEAAKDSEIGHRYAFSSLKTVDDYRAAVPIMQYADIAAMVERMMNGERNVLFDDPAESFVQTGGTSGRAKIFARRALRTGELAGTMLDIAVSNDLLVRDHPKVATGKRLALVTRAPPVGVGFGGSDSYARAYRGSPSFRESVLIDPAWVDELDDAETRMYVLARIAVGRDVVLLSALPVWLLLFLSTLEKSAERMIRDVRDGTITADITQRARDALPTSAPDPERAAALAKAVESAGGRLTATALYPDLSVVMAFMSGSQSQARPVIRELAGVPMREAGLSSTETAGAIAFPVRDEDTNLVLSIHTAFYEFAEEGGGTPKLAHEVVPGARYRLVVTAPNGLFRYDTQDWVEVTGKDLGGAPTLHFVGRQHMSDLVGEKLSEHQAIESIRRAVETAGVSLRAFTLVANRSARDRPAGYTLVAAPAGDADAGALAAALHRCFLECNSGFDALASAGSLSPTTVRWVDDAWFERLRARLAKKTESVKTPIFLRDDDLPEDERG